MRKREQVKNEDDFEREKARKKEEQRDIGLSVINWAVIDRRIRAAKSLSYSNARN